MQSCTLSISQLHLQLKRLNMRYMLHMESMVIKMSKINSSDWYQMIGWNAVTTPTSYICLQYSGTLVHSWSRVLLWMLRAEANIRNSHSHTPCNSKSTQILWNFSHVQAQSHATKHYLAVEQRQMMHVERIGPVLFCATVLQPVTARTTACTDF